MLAFRAGWNYGEMTEAFATTYEVAPASFPPGEYRQITGNLALAYGIVAAGQCSGLPVFLGSYPITPASDILHELSKHKNFNVTTMQAEDCPIFNDGAFDILKEPGEREQRLIPLEDGKPIRFGPDNEFGVVRNDFGGFEVEPYDPARVVVHDATNDDPVYAFVLSRLSTQDLTYTVTGVYRSVARPTYDDQARAQITAGGDLGSLLRGGDTWLVA